MIPRYTLRHLAVVSLALGAVATAGAQTNASGVVLPLTKASPAARGGAITVRTSDAGLVIEGTVDGPVPHWIAPTTASARGDQNRGDRVELWIADAESTRLSPIGWGNQFEYEFLARESDCLARRDTTDLGRFACQAWFREQAAALPALARLFAYHWTMAPGIATESFATPAFSSLRADRREQLALLRPAAPPRASFVTRPKGGYTFRITVPWDALPPVRSLRLDSARLLVEVYGGDSAGTARSTTGRIETRSDGPIDPSRLPIVRFQGAREYFVGPCRSTLANPIVQSGDDSESKDVSDSAVVYVRPGPSLDLRRAIVIDAPAGGYLYSPDPMLTAPIAEAANFWAIDVGRGETLCGPRLAFHWKGGIARSDLVIDESDSVTTRRLANGDVLVKLGPRVFTSAYGAGQCGACPRVGIQMIRIDHRTGEITPAFEFRAIAELDETDFDMAVSADWREITVFEGKTTYDKSDDGVTKWHSTTWCYRPGTGRYETCRENATARPPNPRRIDPLRNG